MLAFFGLSPLSIIVIAVIAVMLFGSDLPQVARKFGSRYREFRRAINDVQQQFREIQNETTQALSIDEQPHSKGFVEEEEAEEEQEPSAPKFTPPA